ncbi:MAG: hypothetical protein ABL931_12130, partial [Usitatibacteraceae bacterium]
VYVQPVDLRRYLRRKLGSGLFATLTIILGNFFLRSWHRISGLTFRSELQILPITHFDDSMIAPVGTAAPSRIHIERTASYLNRRLFDNPRACYVVAGAYSASCCMGYVAWQIATRPDGERWLHIVDWQTRNDHGNAILRALLATVSRKAVEAACGFVMVTLQSHDQRRVLSRAGFMARGDKKIVGVYANDPMRLATLAAAHWSLTDLSEDNDGY